MFHRNVAEQIHLIEHAGVNCYIVEDGPKVMLVDAGLPRMWDMTMKALQELGHSPQNISALVLTHAHFDHVGFAARVEQELNVPIFVHPGDAYLAAHPYSYKHEKSRIFYPLRYPRCIPILAQMTRAGALQVKGINNFKTLHADLTEDLPGHPELVFTPGHTAGHCALHFADRGALITGDALVTMDPYTGMGGPQIVSAAATADTKLALESLTALERTGAGVVLPGHGAPFGDGVEKAVELARNSQVT
ncbi:MBL fold metallo-hydrolase [Specibacter sp. NPDC057265]|uniref:MBL fold metallo-hydrolase n=1 Tax=Specibacter sp. NPDC057265 TaxID=3346075 RepID=UPI0036352CA3